MTMRRLDRKRLFEAEKLGKTVDVGASPLMKDAIVSATQHREGHKAITDIVIDLGSSAVDLKTKASAQGVGIGNSSDASYVCKVDQSVFGVVTSVESVCLEAFSDGVDSDIDLTYGSANGSLGTAPGTSTSFPTDAQQNIMSAVGKSTLSAFDASELDVDGSSGLYINFVAGAATTTTATATIDVSSATVGNIINGVTTIRVMESDGITWHDFVADSSRAWDASAGVNVFGIGASGGSGGNMDSLEKLSYAISTAIHGDSNFTTDAASKVNTDNVATGNATSIVVSHVLMTTTGEGDNYLIDDPQNLSGISVGAFTGGIDNGRDIASGKLLLRFTGFVAPDDI